MLCTIRTNFKRFDETAGDDEPNLPMPRPKHPSRVLLLPERDGGGANPRRMPGPREQQRGLREELPV